jgi:hypothetical protein
MNTNYYYSQGFKFHRSISLVNFISTLGENKIVYGNRVKIYFKSGAKTEDFKNLLPNKISIDSNKILRDKRNLLLESKVLKFNDHSIDVYDLDDRVINYIVSEDQETTLMEDEYSTTWVVNKSTADNPEGLKTIIDQSRYVSWREYPEGEYYSYRYVNTGNAISRSDESSDNDIPTVLAKHNNPINFSTYTKWRLEYANVLIGFYEAIQSQLEGYSIYMDGKKIKCLDDLNSRRIDMSLQGFGNLDRHAFIYNHDLYQTKAELLVRVKTPDQLEYMHLKKKYQNYEFLSNVATFDVLDKLGLPWTNHVWWESYTDQISPRDAKDDLGRLTYTLELRCAIHFYEVEDEMFTIINKIKIRFANLPDTPERVYKLNPN